MNVLKEKKGGIVVVVIVQWVNWVLIVEKPWTAACQAALPFLSPGVSPN